VFIAELALSKVRGVQLGIREYACVYCYCVVTERGRWGKKPADWPEGLPFLDPNNKIKTLDNSGSKPLKTDLYSMLVHLIQKYKVGDF